MQWHLRANDSPIVLKNIHLRAKQWLPFSFKKYTFKSYAMLSSPIVLKNIHLRAMQWLPYSFKKYTFKS